MRSQKGNILIAIIAGLGAGGIVVASWLFIFQSLFFSPSNESILGSNSIEAATQNWRVYENSRQKFSIKYPNTWEFNEGEKDIVFTKQITQFQVYKNEEAKRDFEIKLQFHDNDEDLKIEEWTKKFLKDRNAKKKDELTVNQKTAKRYWSPEDAKGSIDVFYPMDEKVLQLTLVSLDGNDYTDKSKNPYPQQLFFRMVQTLTETSTEAST